jgi:hypothetical protein
MAGRQKREREREREGERERALAGSHRQCAIVGKKRCSSMEAAKNYSPLFFFFFGLLLLDPWGSGFVR